MESAKQKSNIRHNQADNSSAQSALNKRSTVETQLETARRIMRENHEVYKKLAE